MTMKPPKSLECPPTGEAAKPSSSRGFGDDSFRNYMSKKIDMQRKQFGVRLPPPPEPPPSSKPNPHKTKRVVVVGRDESGIDINEKNISTSQSTYNLGEVMDREITAEISKRKKTDRVRFADDVNLDLKATPKNKKKKKKSGMSSILKRLKRKHGEKNKTNPLERRRKKGKSSKSEHRSKEHRIDHDSPDENIRIFLNQDTHNSGTQESSSSVHNSSDEVRSSVGQEVHNTSFEVKEDTPKEAFNPGNLQKFEIVDAEHDPATSKTDQAMNMHHAKENKKSLYATKDNLTDEDSTNNDDQGGDEEEEENFEIEPSHHVHSSRSDMSMLKKQRPDLFFLGVVVLVNGYTNPDTSTIQRMLQRHGGDLEKYETSRITHIIAEHLSTAKANIYKRQRRPTPVCNPRWIVDCVEARRLLPHADYLIQEVQDENVGPKTVKGFFSTTNAITNNIRQRNAASTCHAEEATKIDTLNSKYMKTCYEEENSTTKRQIASVTEAVNDTSLGLMEQGKDDKSHSENKELDQRPATTNAEIVVRDSKSTQGGEKAGGVAGRLRTVGTDPNFLESYFNTSRLSFIGTFKQRARTSPIKKGYTKSDSSHRIVFHVDMDCFFVAVVLRNFPEHRNKPVAISHHGNSHEQSGSKQSRSECATCSYEARKYGVKKGMFLGRARELCPNLIVLPYDFDGYEEVSSQVADILYRQAEGYNGAVEEVSCDEAYLELFVPLAVDSKSIAENIRAEIISTTQCTASVGVANNKLLAKLGTDRAKPDNSYVVKDYRELLEELNLRDLHGVGYRLDRKLQMENLVTVRDIWELGDSAEGELVRILGPGLGKKIFLSCKGEDDRPVKPAERKTIGAECNYGVRFDGPYGVDYMVQGLSQEVQKRMEGVGVRGSRLTFKVKQRKEGAGPPGKFLGHGSCHNLSKSCDTPMTRDWEIFKRLAMKLFEECDVHKDDIRGMGIVISKLAHDKRGDRNANPGRQLTNFFHSFPSGTTDLTGESIKEQSLKPINRVNVPERNTARELFAEDGCKQWPEKTNETTTEESFAQNECETIVESTVIDSNVASMPLPPGKGSGSDFLPSMSQIDRDVLKELPLEIREEIMREAASGSGSTLPSVSVTTTNMASDTIDFDTMPAQFEQKIIEVDDRKPEAKKLLPHDDDSVDGARSNTHQIQDGVVLPPNSQIHMSQVMALPSPLRNQVVSSMGSLSNVHENIGCKEVNIPSSPAVAKKTAVRMKRRKKSLELKKRTNLVFDEDNSRLRQASVKRMLKLAAVKTGVETIANSYDGGSVSLAQLDTLPLELQLQVANNDSCNIGHRQSPTTHHNKYARKSFEATDQVMLSNEMESSVGLPGVAMLPSNTDAIVGTMESESLIDSQNNNHSESIDLVKDDDSEVGLPTTGSFYHDNILPLRRWMDDHADGNKNQNDIVHVKDFLGICVEDRRIEDAIQLLRSIKARQDFWGNIAYKELLRFVVEKAHPVVDGILDVEWLDLAP